jgi:hypothetical protein
MPPGRAAAPVSRRRGIRLGYNSGSRFPAHVDHSNLSSVSAVVGFPPLYGVALVAGALRLPAVAFTVIIFIGRLIRFGSIYLTPGLFK